MNKWIGWFYAVSIFAHIITRRKEWVRVEIGCDRCNICVYAYTTQIHVHAHTHTHIEWERETNAVTSRHTQTTFNKIHVNGDKAKQTSECEKEEKELVEEEKINNMIRSRPKKKKKNAENVDFCASCVVYKDCYFCSYIQWIHIEFVIDLWIQWSPANTLQHTYKCSTLSGHIFIPSFNCWWQTQNARNGMCVCAFCFKSIYARVLFPNTHNWCVIFSIGIFTF